MSTALDKALSAEHSAVYAYGIVGARTTGTSKRRAVAGFDAHRARRDQLRALISRGGGTPAEPGVYQLPFEVGGPVQAARLAAYVEERVTAAYLELTADADPGLRQLAAQAMQEAAVRGYMWSPMVQPFPGMPPEAGAGPSPAVTASEPVPSATVNQ